MFLSPPRQEEEYQVAYRTTIDDGGVMVVLSSLPGTRYGANIQCLAKFRRSPMADRTWLQDRRENVRALVRSFVRYPMLLRLNVFQTVVQVADGWMDRTDTRAN